MSFGRNSGKGQRPTIEELRDEEYSKPDQVEHFIVSIKIFFLIYLSMTRNLGRSRPPFLFIILVFLLLYVQAIFSRTSLNKMY